MNETDFLILALLIGLILGMLFFGGLWFTVRKATVSKTPILWFLGSLIIRSCIVVLGFYYVMQRGNLLNSLITMAGFIVARMMVVRLSKAYEIRISGVKKNNLKKVMNHED